MYEIERDSEGIIDAVKVTNILSDGACEAMDHPSQTNCQAISGTKQILLTRRVGGTRRGDQKKGKQKRKTEKAAAS